MNNDRIKSTIRALLAKATSTTHQGEADTYMAKVMELMERYQVDLHDLHEEDVIGMTVGVSAQAGPPSYKSDVQCKLARYYGAKPILVGTTKKWIVQIIGPESARITTELMTDFVWKQVCDMANGVANKLGVSRAAAIRHVAKALCLRIMLLTHTREAALAKSPAAVGTSFSLAVVDAVDSFMDKLYPDRQQTKSRPKDIKHAAMEAAKGISLHHQTGNGSGTLRLQ